MLRILVMATAMATAICSISQTLMSDTWVATDALGRVMPGAEECPLKVDKPRTVGMFYITWHDEGKYNMKSPYGGDVTQTLLEDPEARLDGTNPAWKERSLHWGEPETGYFLSSDPYIIRRDMSMLTDAGVDLLFLDVTNAVLYWDEWKALFETMEQMKREGNAVPKICFWSFNGDGVKIVTALYDRIYKPGLYKDLWFYWDGKPLLCYNSDPSFDANGHRKVKEYYSQEIQDFFTLRNLWWGYYDWNGKRYVGQDDNWCFGYEMNDPKVAGLTPEGRAAHHNGRVEQMAVTAGQHSISTTGKCFRPSTGQPPLNQYDMPDSAYVPWLGKTVTNPTAYGIYFQDRWDEALEADPDLVYVNDWNEWTAGKFHNPLIVEKTDTIYFDFLGRKSDFYFVDQYNAEFNRTIQPMKGGYTDNYYYQLVQNVRRYKGVNERPTLRRRDKVKIDGRFDDWDKVPAYYLDTYGDTAHRDHNGYGGNHYVNTSGRNDIVVSKVAVGKDAVNFYVETAEDLSPNSDDNWMLLFIDADGDHSTGWNGYDLLVNREVTSDNETKLMTWDKNTGQWVDEAIIPYRTGGKMLELAIPSKYISQARDKKGWFDFKWADNPASIDDIIELCINGDTAPNRRFNYRCQWQF